MDKGEDLYLTRRTGAVDVVGPHSTLIIRKVETRQLRMGCGHWIPPKYAWAMRRNNGLQSHVEWIVYGNRLASSDIPFRTVALCVVSYQGLLGQPDINSLAIWIEVPTRLLID